MSTENDIVVDTVGVPVKEGQKIIYASASKEISLGEVTGVFYSKWTRSLSVKPHYPNTNKRKYNIRAHKSKPHDSKCYARVLVLDDYSYQHIRETMVANELI